MRGGDRSGREEMFEVETNTFEETSFLFPVPEKGNTVSCTLSPLFRFPSFGSISNVITGKNGSRERQTEM